MATILERDEYVEQAYFFRMLRERITENTPTQEALISLHQEILSSTRLPMAIQFIAGELKHSGLLQNGFAKLPHYFSAFQAFVIRQAEDETRRIPMTTALLALEREAAYKADKVSSAGLFVYQFELIARNRMGYDDGLRAMADDPHFDENWRPFLTALRKQLGLVDFADIIFFRSESASIERRRLFPDWTPPQPMLFGEKEGKIAKACRGRDPLYLFAALQRQLGYPEVPRFKGNEESIGRIEMLTNKIRELEARIKLVESEMKGQVDLSQFGTPELLKDQWPKDDD